VLTVTDEHLCNRFVHLLALPTRVDARPTTLVAAAHRHLMTRAAFVVGTAERAPSDLEQQGIVVDLAAEIGTHARLQIAKQRHRFWSHFEAEPVFDVRRIGRCVGRVTRQPACHGFFDLVHAPAVGPIESSTLGL
jgi:hypothetical protein